MIQIKTLWQSNGLVNSFRSCNTSTLAQNIYLSLTHLPYFPCGTEYAYSSTSKIINTVSFPEFPTQAQ